MFWNITCVALLVHTGFYDTVLINCSGWLFTGMIVPLHFVPEGKGKYIWDFLLWMFKTTPGLFNTCAVFVAGLNSYHLPKANNSFVIAKQYTHKFGTDCISNSSSTFYVTILPCLLEECHVTACASQGFWPKITGDSEITMIRHWLVRLFTGQMDCSSSSVKFLKGGLALIVECIVFKVLFNF